MDANMPIRGLLEQPKAARDLWTAIAENCHRLVLSAGLASEYWEKLRLVKRRASPESATAMAAIMNGILVNAEKTIWVAPQGLEPHAHKVRDPDDWFLEDIALDAITSGSADQCGLVTVDAATRADFNHPELIAAGIRGLTIEEANAVAEQEC
jgi:predicted nucleic acid-binding protein